MTMFLRMDLFFNVWDLTLELILNYIADADKQSLRDNL